MEEGSSCQVMSWWWWFHIGFHLFFNPYIIGEISNLGGGGFK